MSVDFPGSYRWLPCRRAAALASRSPPNARSVANQPEAGAEVGVLPLRRCRGLAVDLVAGASGGVWPSSSPSSFTQLPAASYPAAACKQGRTPSASVSLPAAGMHTFQKPLQSGHRQNMACLPLLLLLLLLPSHCLQHGACRSAWLESAEQSQKSNAAECNQSACPTCHSGSRRTRQPDKRLFQRWHCLVRWQWQRMLAWPAPLFGHRRRSCSCCYSRRCRPRCAAVFWLLLQRRQPFQACCYGGMHRWEGVLAGSAWATLHNNLWLPTLHGGCSVCGAVGQSN